MFALDVVIFSGFYFFLSWRTAPKEPPTFPKHAPFSVVYNFPPVSPTSSLSTSSGRVRLSIFMDLFSVAFFGGIETLGIGFIAKLFRINIGQCVAEGLTYHISAFLLLTAFLLFWKRRKLVAVFCGLLGLSIFGLGFDMLVWEPYHLAVEKYVIETPKLKKTLRIVFVADIQTDRIGSHERRTLKLIQKQHADLILLGGDYLQYYEGTPNVADLPERFDQLFQEIPLEAPLGVYAIAGNIGTNDLFKNTGVEMVNDSTILENLGAEQGIGPIDVVLLSLDDSAGDVGERGLTETGNFIVMAGHYPNYAIDGFRSERYHNDYKGYRQAERAPDLMLAGHTHGSQAALPFYGPLKFFGDHFVEQIPRKMLSGMFKYDNGGRLLVTRGSGMERGWAPRIRFCCRPEISVIDLVPAKK
jgi:predicted MPP superfamily phosphohydrolase